MMNNDVVALVANANVDNVNNNSNNRLLPSDDNGSSESNGTTTTSSAAANDSHVPLLAHVQAKMTALEEATQTYIQAEREMLRLTRELCELRNFKPPPQQQHKGGDEEEQEADGVASGSRTPAEVDGYVYRRYLGPEIYHLENLIQYIMPLTRGQWNKALQWAQDCIAVRCNDPHHTQIKAYNPSSGHPSSHPMLRIKNYGTILNGCLQYNTHITDLTVNMNTLLLGERFTRQETNEQIIASMKSILQPVLQYIATSPILRRVSLVSDNSTRSRDLAAAFLEVTSQSPFIEELELAGRIPPPALATLLSSTCSITTLSMDCYAMSNAGLEQIVENRELCEAFAFQNNTNCAVLQNIRLTSFDIHWARLLMHMAEYGCATQLQQLTLVATTNDGNDAQQQDLRGLMFLIQHSMTLKHVTLEEFVLNVDVVNCVLRGIRRRFRQRDAHTSTTTYSTMTKLTLNLCTFSNDAAARTFIRFFQQSPAALSSIDPNTHDCGSTVLRPSSIVQRPVLPELEIKFNHETEETENMQLDGLSLGRAMASLIMPPATSVVVPHVATSIAHDGEVARNNVDTNNYKTIGSQLQVLSLHPFAYMTGFCETLLVHAKTAQLPALHLSYLVPESIPELITCLPYLCSVQDLRLSMVDGCIRADTVLALIQQCGFLRTVTVLDDDQEPFFNNRELRLAKSFCDRNQVLCQIRMRHFRPDYGDRGDSEYYSQAAKRHKTGHGCDIHENVSLLPMLLHAAKQVPYTRASVLVSAIQCLEYDLFGSEDSRLCK